MNSVDLIRAHEGLREALQRVLAIRSLLNDASSDTCLAVGEAMGIISKAKGLLGRDIDAVGRR